MNSGPLRDRITIQARPADKDGGGQRSLPYADVPGLARMQSEVSDLTGRELATAQAITAEASVGIRMRGFRNWRAQLKPDMRAVQDLPDGTNRLFDIKAILNPDGRDRELRLICVEYVS